MDEAFVTDAVARHLARAGWELHSVARPQMGSGTLIRPEFGDKGSPDKVAGGFVIDIIAVHANLWLFLESKDRFSMVDLDKLQRVRDDPTFDSSLRRLTHNAPKDGRLFGLCMPWTERWRTEVVEHTTKLDTFIGVLETGICSRLGGRTQIPGI